MYFSVVCVCGPTPSLVCGSISSRQLFTLIRLCFAKSSGDPHRSFTCHQAVLFEDIRSEEWLVHLQVLRKNRIDMDFDAIIVGAGPYGISGATYLKNRG